MPRRKTGGPKQTRNPELLAKLKTKCNGLAFNRMGDAAKLRASKAEEGTSEKYAEAFEAVSKMAPGLLSSAKSKKRLEVILSMIDKHGLEDTLKLLKISDSNLKGALASIFGTSEDNPLADATAPTVDESKLQAAAASFFNKQDESKEPPVINEENAMRRKILPYKDMCEADPLYRTNGSKTDEGQDGGRRPPPEVAPGVAHEPPTDHVTEPVGTHNDAGKRGVEKPHEEGPIKNETIATQRPKIQRFVP